MSSKVARETRARQAEIASLAGDDAVLARVRLARKRQRVLERELFFLAIEIARRCPITDECARFGCHTPADFGVGFCEDAGSWFGAVAGYSSQTGEMFLLEALEVAERLPRLYERVLDGRTQPHTARLVAEQTLTLSDEAARFVDAQVAAAGVIRGRYAIKGLVREAMIAHMPEEYAALQEVEADPRKADVWVGTDGRGRVDAVLDAFSAVKLEDTLQYGAAQLKAAGSQEVLDTRRSFAFSDLIEAANRPEHHQDAFDLTAGDGGTVGADGGAGVEAPLGAASTASDEHVGHGADVEAGRPRWSGRGVPPTRVSLFVHVNASAFWPDGNPASGPIDPDHVAGRQDREPVRIDGPGLPTGVRISAAELRALFTRPSCGGDSGSGCVPEPPRITVRPVIDLEEEHSVEGYTAGDVVKEHLALRDGTCVFPFCTRAAGGCDADHMIPWRIGDDGDPIGGPTCTCNLASLCRTHHRWKTHSHQIRARRISTDTSNSGSASDRGRGAGGAPGGDAGRSPASGGAPPRLRETWSYEMVAPGVYYWTSPMGGRFLRTRTGTIEVTDDAWHRRDLHARRDDLDEAAVARLEHENGDDVEPDLGAILADPHFWARAAVAAPAATVANAPADHRR